MLKWVAIEREEQVEAIAALSHSRPCVVYKHSTRCSLSSLAKYRLEKEWNLAEDAVATFYIDIIAHRHLSRYLSERFEVYHESPQVLLIRDGECTYDASHLDISVADLRSAGLES